MSLAAPALHAVVREIWDAADSALNLWSNEEVRAEQLADLDAAFVQFRALPPHATGRQPPCSPPVTPQPAAGPRIPMSTKQAFDHLLVIVGELRANAPQGTDVVKIDASIEALKTLVEADEAKLADHETRIKALEDAGDDLDNGLGGDPAPAGADAAAAIDPAPDQQSAAA